MGLITTHCIPVEFCGTANNEKVEKDEMFSAATELSPKVNFDVN